MTASTKYTTSWRLIPYAEHDAAMNMAIDEALLESHRNGLAVPTLRLYGFRPAAVSIGYAQKLEPEAIERIEAAGYDIVRRPTGGRAVLHLNDLTYSFVGTAHSANARTTSGDTAHATSAFLSPSISVAYKQICAGLIESLRILNIRVELGASDTAYRQLHDCFHATTSADLHHNGKKLAGSAQLRRGTAVLQHGSLLLNQDQTAMERLLFGRSDRSPLQSQVVPANSLHERASAIHRDEHLAPSDRNRTPNQEQDEQQQQQQQQQQGQGQGQEQEQGREREREQLQVHAESTGTDKNRHANLFDIAGKEYSLIQLQCAIKDGFESAFGVAFEIGCLSEHEDQLARRLHLKYSVSVTASPDVVSAEANKA